MKDFYYNATLKAPPKREYGEVTRTQCVGIHIGVCIHLGTQQVHVRTHQARLYPSPPHPPLTPLTPLRDVTPVKMEEGEAVGA